MRTPERQSLVPGEKSMEFSNGLLGFPSQTLGTNSRPFRWRAHSKHPFPFLRYDMVFPLKMGFTMDQVVLEEPPQEANNPQLSGEHSFHPRSLPPKPKTPNAPRQYSPPPPQPPSTPFHPQNPKPPTPQNRRVFAARQPRAFLFPRHARGRG